SERAWAKVLEVTQRAFGPQHPSTGRPLAYLGLAALRQGRVNEADELLRRAEPLVKQSSRPDDLPEWMTFRSYLEHQLRHDDAAFTLAKQALDRRRDLARTAASRPGANASGKSPYLPSIAHSALVVAREYIGVSRFKEAIAPAEESVQSYIQSFGA